MSLLEPLVKVQMQREDSSLDKHPKALQTRFLVDTMLERNRMWWLEDKPVMSLPVMLPVYKLAMQLVC